MCVNLIRQLAMLGGHTFHIVSPHIHPSRNGLCRLGFVSILSVLCCPAGMLFGQTTASATSSTEFSPQTWRLDDRYSGTVNHQRATPSLGAHQEETVGVALASRGNGTANNLGTVTLRPGRNAGLFFTLPLTPPPIQDITAVLPHVEHGTVKGLHLSLDRGKTWVKVAPDTLTRLPLKGDGSDSITIRGELRRTDASMTPIVTHVSLRVRPKKDHWLVMRNDFLRIVCCGKTGGLFRITDVSNDREIIWPTRPEGPFTVDLKQQGKSRWTRFAAERSYQVAASYDPTTTKVTQRSQFIPTPNTLTGKNQANKSFTFTDATYGPDNLTLHYTVGEALRVAINIRLDQTAQSIWTIHLTNQEQHRDVIRAEFPILPALRLGSSAKDDHQVRCQTAGWHRFRPATRPLKNAKYPGALALPWESHFDSLGGLGIIVRDPDLTHCEFASRRWSRPLAATRLAIRKLNNIRSGGGEMKWEFTVSVHDGDWHWLADRYRSWASTWMQRPTYPQWFALNDGYWVVDLHNTGMPFSHVLRYYGRRARRMGIGHLQVWGQFGFRYGNCCGAFWQPSPRFGGEAQFEQMIRNAHRDGFRMGFYFLHHMCDFSLPRSAHVYGVIPKSEYPSGTEFPDASLVHNVQLVTDPSGTHRPFPLNEKQWTSYETAVNHYRPGPRSGEIPRVARYVDISDKVWQDYLRRWAVDRYGLRWGADGMYNDVLGCGPIYESYDTRKHHHGHGLWGLGKSQIAQSLNEAAADHDLDDWFQLMEGMCDVPGQFCAATNLGIYRDSKSKPSLDHSETVRYTWPDMVVFEAAIGAAAAQEDRIVQSAWLNGNRFGLRNTSSSFSRLLFARRSIRHLLYPARFMDVIGLDSPLPARWFQVRDPAFRGTIITLLNPNKVRTTLSLAHPHLGRPERALALDDEGHMVSVPVDRVAETIRLRLPKLGKHVAVVLAGKIETPQGLIVLPVIQRVPQLGMITLRLGNLSDTPFNCQIRSPAALRLAGLPDTPILVASGAVTDVTFQVQNMGDQFETIPLTFVIDGNTVNSIDVPMLPFVEDGSFEETGNELEFASQGQRCLKLEPEDTTRRNIIELDLETGRKYRLSFDYTSKSESITGPKNALARVYGFFAGQGQRAVTEGTLSVATDWRTWERDFQTSDSLISCRLVIYHTRAGRRPLWIDNVRIEDRGAVETGQ